MHLGPFFYFEAVDLVMVMLALRFVQNTVKLFWHCLWAMLDIGICLPTRCFFPWLLVVDILTSSDFKSSSHTSEGPWNTTCSLDFGGTNESDFGPKNVGSRMSNCHPMPRALQITSASAHAFACISKEPVAA